jgi:hypothetical protein
MMFGVQMLATVVAGERMEKILELDGLFLTQKVFVAEEPLEKFVALTMTAVKILDYAIDLVSLPIAAFAFPTEENLNQTMSLLQKQGALPVALAVVSGEHFQALS